MKMIIALVTMMQICLIGASAWRISTGDSVVLNIALIAINLCGATVNLVSLLRE